MMGLFDRSYPSVKLRNIASKCLNTGTEALAVAEAPLFDYIIVGGGTAGCVLANRLASGLPNAKILLLERGQLHDSFASRVPLLSLAYGRSDAAVVKYESSPQLHLLDQRKMHMITGKVLGGTSRLNNGLYTRCQPGEFNDWGHGWSYGDLEPLYERSENNLEKSHTKDKIGEWTTRIIKPFFPSSQIFRETITGIGIPYIGDTNDPNQPIAAITKLRTTVSANGKRCSAFEAFLPATFVKQHGNLKVCFGAVVQRLDIIQQDDICKVQGVFVEDENGKAGTYYVKGRETILCGGAISSPQLLLLSGIGPQDELAQLNISAQVNLPGVGKHLQDHISVPLSYRVPLSSSIHVLQARPIIAIKALLEYFLYGTGLFTSPVVEYTCFLRSDRYPQPSTETENDPRIYDNIADIELAWISAFGSAESEAPKSNKHGYNTILVQAIRPKSTGSITLVNRDARIPPSVDPNYLGSEEDMEILRKGIKYGLDIGRKMMATGYDMVEELVPKDEDSVDEFIRTNLTGAYHLSCTCRMAKREKGGVINEQLRVYGVEGLRVADASVFPRLIGVKPQATIVLVGEKCADLILGAGGIS